MFFLSFLRVSYGSLSDLKYLIHELSFLFQ